MATTILFPIVLSRDTSTGRVLLEDINHHCYEVRCNDGNTLTDAAYELLKSDPILGFYDVVSHYKITFVGRDHK